MRGLEERLGVRLLTRTTRSVATTEAGERLLVTLRPALADIAAALIALRSSRDTPAGTVRITAVKHAVTSGWGRCCRDSWRAIPTSVSRSTWMTGSPRHRRQRYDAGVRFSGSVDRDMVAVRIGPEIGVAVVAAPSYLAGRPALAVPKDLADHRCIVHRRSDGSGIYPWPFHENGRVHQLRVSGPLAFNDSDLVLAAAVAGQGVACVFADQAEPYVAEARLVQVLARGRQACRATTYIIRAAARTLPRWRRCSRALHGRSAFTKRLHAVVTMAGVQLRARRAKRRGRSSSSKWVWVAWPRCLSGRFKGAWRAFSA